MSTSKAFPLLTSVSITNFFTSSSDNCPKPSCPRQRLTFPTTPPPSPEDVLTLTLPWLTSPPGKTNFATRNWPPATSCHPEGTTHFGFPSLLAAAEGS